MFKCISTATLLITFTCANIGLGDDNADLMEKTVTQEATLMDSLREFIGKLMDGGSSGIARKLLQADISSRCSLGLLKLMRGIRNLEPWAVRLLDSTGKYPSGLFQGTQADLGAFDECLETVVHDQYGNEKVRAQYCSVYINVVNDTSFTEAMLPAMKMSHSRAEDFLTFASDPRIAGINLGICIINDCSRGDLQAIANAVSGKKIHLHVHNCVTSEYQAPDRRQTAIIIGFGVIALLMVCSTVYDIYIIYSGTVASRNQGLLKLLTAFSVVSSTRTLFATNSDKESESYRYRFLHGIRLLSAGWIVSGHSAVVFGNNLGRRLSVLQFHEELLACFISCAFLSVDTFFFLSGFLLAYNIQMQKSNRVLVAVVAIVRRHIRTTIPLLVVIAALYLLPLIASGPGLVEMMGNFYYEMDKHLYELICQIRNFGKGLDNTGCFQHLWYISADFQLFLVGLFVFQCFKGKPWIIISIFGTLSLLCCSFSAWQMYGTPYYPFPVVLGETLDAVLGTINDVYVLPSYHAACYFSGGITFLLLEKYGNARIPKAISALLWTVAAACCLTCVFVKYDWNRGRAPKSDWPKMAVAFWDKVLWSFTLSWTVFACATHRGGLVQKFLSLKVAVPLSRLTLGTYLTHLPFILVVYNTSRERIYYSKFNMISMFFSVAAWSTLLSYMLFVCCEVPTARLEKMLFTRQSAQKDKTLKEVFPAHMKKTDLPGLDEKPAVVIDQKNCLQYYESQRDCKSHF